MERRRFLKGAGVAIALPVMESLMPKARGAVNKKPIRRFVCLSNNYGVYQKAFFPDATQAGKNYDMPETLSLLKSTVKISQHFRILIMDLLVVIKAYQFF